VLELVLLVVVVGGVVGAVKVVEAIFLSATMKMTRMMMTMKKKEEGDAYYDKD
jgi:hypothetical protein